MEAAKASKPDVSAVYAVDLSQRPVPQGDAAREKAALLQLARRMHDAPGEMLPRFVELAMELTGGISAGISLLEEAEPSPVFRWHYLKGILSPFNGATTPRDFSPCGITLDRSATTLTIHPERVYDWIPSGLFLPEVLLVPLYIGRTEPLGTLWIVADRIEHFHCGHAATMQELADFIGIALKMVRSEEELQQALEQQELLTREMGHRLKNLFTILDGMVRISARTTDNKDDLVALLSGSLHALAAAHSLVRPSFSEVQGAASSLAELLSIVLEPHESPAISGKRRLSLTGPTVLCGEQSVNGLALVFHELATNAAKYGSLCGDLGTVDVVWQIDGGDLGITWREDGGAQATSFSPASKGFGSTLVEATVIRQFGGTLSYDWRSTGLSVHIVMPLCRLAQ
ncbi:sensor histidine kinase [Sinorhizobium meliloti]|uniref:sensor histidine kinase n=1 Tax=Rhizobium meliloti TaxID=382 RepID=UPI000FD78E2E|nr:HWE histidine kinase domain-containing protein [Sinorhizobium meliloti]RVO21655.1 histidine kinase [Sinorhizobium meliloti]